MVAWVALCLLYRVIFLAPLGVSFVSSLGAWLLLRLVACCNSAEATESVAAVNSGESEMIHHIHII